MTQNVQLSGERLKVTYLLKVRYNEAFKKARDICHEQTVEFPEDLVPAGFIKDEIVGRVEEMNEYREDAYRTIISYAVETTGFEITQLLNVIFGNTSIKPGVRVEEISLPDVILNRFKGPRFGRKGLRELIDVPNRPLLCTALKPMGLSATELAKLAYQFVKGGIDIIKDDHGLADQIFCPFKERVRNCSKAVSKANQETGNKSVYMANISGPIQKIVEKAYFAKEAGAGGLLISPGLVGFDTVRQLAEDDALSLPIIAHPALFGSFVTSPDNGIAHGVLFGLLMRLIGADAIIYPNYGGRFSFSRIECESIAKMTETHLGHLAPIFPAPAGGMTIDRLLDMYKVYGNDVIFLIGGDLHRHGNDLIENSRNFRKIIENL